MSFNVKFSPPDISLEEINEVVDTLTSGWITTGPKTKQLEQMIADFCHVQRVVCLNSATACLELVLRLLGVGPGDEVITSAYTYTASCSVICHVGATPVLVDTAPGSFHLDLEKVEAAINERTKAIIPVDVAGLMCDYDRLFDVVQRKKTLFKPSSDWQRALGRVAVVEDAAHALGATYKGRNCGSIADFTCFSFHAVKNFTTAEGGAVAFHGFPCLTSDQIYHSFMLASLHGQTKDALAKTKEGAWEYDVLFPAYKCNMTDVLASIGIAQLKRYPSMLEIRKKIIHRYDQAFQNLDVELMRHFSNDYGSSGHLYMLRLNHKDEAFRNHFIQILAEHGIPANVHYKPLPMLTAYKNLGFSILDFPNAFAMYQNEVTLPLHSSLTDEEVQEVIEQVIHALSVL